MAKEVNDASGSHDERNVKQAVPLFGVTNMEASLRFYVDGLGFKMKRWWIPQVAV
jgi:hypothetical protein